MNFQFHLIARLDYTCKISREDIRVHLNFPFALKKGLNWAKNYNEERDTPWQIALGCMIVNFCALISLLLWMASAINFFPNSKLTSYLFRFLSGCHFPQGGKSGKDIIRKYISTAIKGLEDLE